VKCEGRVNITEAEQLREALLEAIESRAQVCIDLSDAEDIDTAALQVVVSAAAAAQAGDKSLTITETTQTVSDTCRLLGLDTKAPFAALPR